MRHRTITGIVVIILIVATGCHRVARPTADDPPAADGRLTPDQLRADLRQLVGYLESAHPDPYGGRGKVAFHRDVREILDAIDPAGMTDEEFLRLVRPLVASLGDAHATIHRPWGKGDDMRAWIQLEPVDGALVVSRVYRDEDRELLGGAVVSIGGVEMGELRRRMSRIRGTENQYAELENVARSMRQPGVLSDLLDWEKRPQTVPLEVLRSGQPLRGQIPIADPPETDGYAPTSRIVLPEPNAASMAWAFLDEEHTVAYLRIDSMMSYREAFEIWHATGYISNLGEYLTQTAEEATGGPVPEGIEERIARVPSGAEMFVELFTEMKQAGTEQLIVDVRRNRGGQSYLSWVLAYFLYGADALAAVDEGYQIKRYSQLYLDNYASDSVESLREKGFELGEYDFTSEREWLARRSQTPTEEQLEQRRADVLEWLEYSPTVRGVLGQGEWEEYWTPRVSVLTSANTFSAGFDVAVTLNLLGASLVGVPPAQAGNCYIDSLGYELEHSGLTGSLSFKRSLLFPDNEEKGELLRPDLELTLADLEAMEFDPNAAVLLVVGPPISGPPEAPAAEQDAEQQ